MIKFFILGFFIGGIVGYTMVALISVIDGGHDD